MVVNMFLKSNEKSASPAPSLRLGAFAFKINIDTAGIL
jgi:hypothetical protein